MTFTPTNTAIRWITSAGPVRLEQRQARDLLDLFREAHDDALRDGDREAARTARALYLDLDEALSALPVVMPELRPLTCVVREIDPDAWKAA